MYSVVEEKKALDDLSSVYENIIKKTVDEKTKFVFSYLMMKTEGSILSLETK